MGIECPNFARKTVSRSTSFSLVRNSKSEPDSDIPGLGLYYGTVDRGSLVPRSDADEVDELAAGTKKCYICDARLPTPSYR